MVRGTPRVFPTCHIRHLSSLLSICQLSSLLSVHSLVSSPLYLTTQLCQFFFFILYHQSLFPRPDCTFACNVVVHGAQDDYDFGFHLNNCLIFGQWLLTITWHMNTIFSLNWEKNCMVRYMHAHLPTILTQSLPPLSLVDYICTWLCTLKFCPHLTVCTHIL